MEKILIEVSDDRKYIIDAKNLRKVVEYLKIFNINFKKITTNKEPINLRQLATAICSNVYENKSKRPSKANQTKIQNYITEELASGRIFNLKEVRMKFSSIDATFIYNTFYSIKNALKKSGVVATRLGCGRYQVFQP